MRYCPHCQSEYQSWGETCPDCDVPLVDTLPYEVIVTFLMKSGETQDVTVLFTQEPDTATLENLADELAADIARNENTPYFRKFGYWADGHYFIDAVRLSEVVSFSIAVAEEEPDLEEEETR